MHSRAWIGIVVIGILGLALMGLMTKFAIDSNSELQDMIRFKSAFADEFKGAGVEEVSLRRQTGGGGYVLVVTCSPGRGSSDPARLDRDIAAYFVENFPDRSARRLELSYVTGGSFGCRSDEAYRKQEIALGQLRQEQALGERKDKLFRSLEADYGVSLVSESRERREVVLRLRVPGSSREALEALASKIEPSIRAFYGIHPYFRLCLRFVAREAAPATDVTGGALGHGEPPGAAAGAPLLEASFDARGERIQNPTERADSAKDAGGARRGSAEP